jgi:hypothetical protein
MSQTVNNDYTVIPDEAEVWIIMASSVTGGIASKIPTSISVTESALVALGWERIGYIDDEKGIPLKPTSELKKYNAFGHRNFRAKVKNGELETGFTAIEVLNPVVKKLTVQGSAPNKIAPPRNVQCYLLYRVVDEDTALGTAMWVTLAPCPVQWTNSEGFIEGEKGWYELTVNHTNDSNGDTFQVVDASTDDVLKVFTIAAGVTGYTATVDGQTTASITAKTKAALQAALRLLPTVTALPSPGVVVDGPDGGPLAATFTGPVTAVSATGTGGTVTVA